MTVHLRLCDKDHEWDELIRGFEHTTLFHTSDWLRFQQNVSGMRLRLCVFEQNGRAIGVFPVFLGHKGGMRLAVSPPYRTCTPRLGPLVSSPEALEDVLVCLDEWFATVKADYIDVYFPREVNPGAVRRHGYVVESRYTYLLDLTGGEEEVFNKKLKRVCRKAVRKATKSSIQIIEAALEDHIDRYYEMARITYSRTSQSPPLSKEFLLCMERALLAKNHCRTLWAKYEDRLVACCIFGYYRDTVYSIDAVADREYTTLAPNNLLHWELIRWAIAQGMAVYDMVGANTPPIARFKATFGPELVAYTYAWKSRTLRAKLGRAVFRKCTPVIRTIRYKLAKLLGKT